MFSNISPTSYAKVVLEAAEENWLTALKKHTQVKEKTRSYLMATLARMLISLLPHSEGGGGGGRELLASSPLSSSSDRRGV